MSDQKIPVEWDINAEFDKLQTVSNLQSMEIEKLESSLAAAKGEIEHLKQINGFNGHSIEEGRKSNYALREALESIKLMVDAQARDEGLWSVPLAGTQPITEAYLQRELRRLHECIEHYCRTLSAGRE